MEQGDEYYMELALAEAARGLGRTSPNPAVGALLVREGSILGIDMDACVAPGATVACPYSTPVPSLLLPHYYPL